MGQQNCVCIMCFILSVFSFESLRADLVDFESGFVDLQPVPTVTTETNLMSVSLSNGGSGFIAEVGGPVTAFEPNDDPVGGTPGSYFLSDGGANFSLDFFFVFDNPVQDLALELYDFELATGRFATLSVFSDFSFSDLVGSDVTNGTNEQGGIIEMSVFGTQAIRSASLSFNVVDNGVGIDNISFTTVPEPSTLVFLGALFSFGIASRKPRRS